MIRETTYRPWVFTKCMANPNKPWRSFFSELRINKQSDKFFKQYIMYRASMWTSKLMATSNAIENDYVVRSSYNGKKIKENPSNDSISLLQSDTNKLHIKWNWHYMRIKCNNISSWILIDN